MYSSEYTCTSSEISVTTNIIITARPSICVPTVSLVPAFSNHVNWWMTGSTCASPPSVPSRPMPRPSAPMMLAAPCESSAFCTRLIHCTIAPMESRNDAHTATIPTSAPWRGKRLPSRRITTNESAGISGTSHAWSRKNIPSALQRVDVVEVGAVQVAVDEQDDGETDAHFRGRDRQHEQREHLPDRAGGVGVVERAERHEIDVHRDEHQLDAHQHEHRVPAREHAVDAGAEEERAEHEELVEQHQSRLARTTAPTSAPSRSTSRTSNGMR